MSELPPIPGIHRRSCTACGAAVTLTAAESTVVRQGRTTETREASCPQCRSSVRYTVKLRDDASTIIDTSEKQEFVGTLRRLLGLRT